MTFQDRELLDLVDEAWSEAWSIVVDETGWKEEKRSDDGDVVKSKKSKKGFIQNTKYKKQYYVVRLGIIFMPNVKHLIM